MTKHLFMNFTTYCHSHLVRVEPESSLEFITNIYPLRIDLRIIPMCSHGSITRWTEDGSSSYAWILCDLDCDAFILVSTTLPLYDSCLWIEPMVTNIAFRHLPTNPLSVLLTLLQCIVLAYDSGHLSRSREPN